jgi:hypothetical protein
MRITSGITTALQALKADTFVTLRTRLDHGGSLQGRRLPGGAVQLY